MHKFIWCILCVCKLLCVTLTGWSSRSKKSKAGGGGDRGAEESDEDTGYKICGDEKGGRGKGKSVVPIINNAS